jgi:DNA/RNA endonuclease YhcR with UshA esterase domain
MHRLHRHALIGSTCFALCAVGALALAAGGSISSARHSPAGTVVTVEGVVSTPSGALAPNDQGFAIQAGPHGIYIHDSLGVNYQLGQRVSVTGSVGDNFGQVWGVFPTSIAVTGSHPVHPPRPRATGQISEATESLLVRVRGTVTDDVLDDAPYGWRFHLDDGSGEVTIFIYTGAGVDVSGISRGDELEITGLSGQFLDHYEVNPRSQADLVER